MRIVRTIEIPEELAARLEATPEAVADFNAFAVAAIARALDDGDDLPEDLKDALREGAEDIRAGRFYPAEEMDARVEAFLQERRKAREEAAAA